MKIVIVSQYYAPEVAVIPVQLAEGLVARGHKVRVVTGFPNYPEGVLFTGYRQRFSYDELLNGVDVRRVPSIINHSTNSFARVANYMSFALSTVGATRFIRGADVVYVYATPMTASIAAAFWRKLHRLPFVLHVQDLWPESVTGSSLVPGQLLGRLIDRVLGPWLRQTYLRCAAIIAIAPTMSTMLKERGAPATKVHTVMNWAADESDSQTQGGACLPKDRQRLHLVYAGNVGDLQDLETIVRAAGMVQDLEALQITIIGSGIAREKLILLASDLRITNVRFRERVAPSAMTAIYADSDFQLVTLKDLPIFAGTIPSKLQASLARGVPVITNIRGDVGTMVSNNRIGFAVSPGDVDSLAVAFRQSYRLSEEERRSMGARALALYAREMSSSKGIDAIEQILESASRLTPRKGLVDELEPRSSRMLSSQASKEKDRWT